MGDRIRRPGEAGVRATSPSGEPARDPRSPALVAHDLRNRIAVILACSELLAERLGSAHALSPEIDEIARNARDAAALMHELDPGG